MVPFEVHSGISLKAKLSNGLGIRHKICSIFLKFRTSNPERLFRTISNRIRTFPRRPVLKTKRKAGNKAQVYFEPWSQKQGWRSTEGIHRFLYFRQDLTKISISIVSSDRDDLSLLTKKPVVLKVRSASVELGGRLSSAWQTWSRHTSF